MHLRLIVFEITMIHRRRYSSENNNVYKVDIIGSMIIRDDPNDDWLCISFDIWIGDFVPGSLYINKLTKKTRIDVGSQFSCWLFGFIINKNLINESINDNHKKLLDKLLSDILYDKHSIINTRIPCFRQRV